MMLTWVEIQEAYGGHRFLRDGCRDDVCGFVMRRERAKRSSAGTGCCLLT